MKKSMKLLWMVLFALPLFAMTSCGDDDDELDGVNFKDYSSLLGKTRSEAMKQMGITVSDEDLEGIYYLDVPEKNIDEVDVMFSFKEENEYGASTTYDQCVMVDVNVYGFTYPDLFNFLQDKYGKGELNKAGILVFTKGNMYVWFDVEDAEDQSYWLTYVDKKKFDDAFGTKAGAEDIFGALKARHATK